MQWSPVALCEEGQCQQVYSRFQVHGSKLSGIWTIDSEIGIPGMACICICVLGQNIFLPGHIDTNRFKKT